MRAHEVLPSAVELLDAYAEKDTKRERKKREFFCMRAQRRKGGNSRAPVDRRARFPRQFSRKIYVSRESLSHPKMRIFPPRFKFVKTLGSENARSADVRDSSATRQ